MSLRSYAIVFVLALQGLANNANAVPAQPDPDMGAVLAHLKDLKPKPIETLTAKQARKQPTPTDAVKKEMKAQKLKPDTSGFADVDNTKIEGAAGKIPARIYRPEGLTANAPLIVYFHGGGFVIADLDVYDASARALAKQAKAVILSVHYRQGPENKFPAAHEDAFAAYKWALDNADKLKIDKNNIAVAGESAGGNLAINVAMKARDAKIQMPVHELLVYPVAGSDMNTPSYQENADAKPLNKPMMAWFVKNYLTSMDQAKDPRITVLAADLKGLPPTTIIAAQIDPLRSEGKELADKLQAAGVKVTYQLYDGVTHEFFGMAPVVKKAVEAQAFAAGELSKAFAHKTK